MMPKSLRSIYTGKKRRDFVPVLEWFDAVPPWKCRAAAVSLDGSGGKKKIARIPVAELARLSGIPRRTISWISYRTSWCGITVSVASAFAFACGVNMLAPDPLNRYVRRQFKKGLPYFHKKQRDALDKAAKAK